MTVRVHRAQGRTGAALLRKPEEQTKDTILLVDDDAGIRMTVGDILSRSGCFVLTAVDGSAALRVLRGGIVIDLVITDYQMPGMGDRRSEMFGTADRHELSGRSGLLAADSDFAFRPGLAAYRTAAGCVPPSCRSLPMAISL